MFMLIIRKEDVSIFSSPEQLLGRNIYYCTTPSMNVGIGLDGDVHKC